MFLGLKIRITLWEYYKGGNNLTPQKENQENNKRYFQN